MFFSPNPHRPAGSTRLLPDAPTELLGWLELAFTVPLRSGQTLVLTVPAPRLPVERLLTDEPEDGFLWDDGRHVTCAGLGRALRIRGFGGRRALRVHDQLRSLGHSLVQIHHASVDAPPPRFFGGMSFSPLARARSLDDPWLGFEDADFTLPEVLYGHGADETAYLRFAWSAEKLSDPKSVHRAIEQIFETFDRLSRPSRSPIAASRRSHARLVDVARDDAESRAWKTGVEHLCRRLQVEDLHKVVAARTRRRHLSDAPSMDQLLSATRSAPEARSDPERSDVGFRFAFTRESRLFFGWTPERLIQRRGLQIRTEALAGTATGSSSNAKVRLLKSSKDRREHQLVADTLRLRLKPFCDSLVSSAAPETRWANGVCHLRTPVHGRLKHAVSALSLGAALHPTPAVGGLPNAPALRWIHDWEGDRGWYASPIGWIDTRGDGDLAVALRCGLLNRSDGELRTFAGAGIVQGSDPQRELEETELKERSFLKTFGLDEVEI